MTLTYKVGKSQIILFLTILGLFAVYVAESVKNPVASTRTPATARLTAEASTLAPAKAAGSNWKRISNKNGWSIEYPVDWEVVTMDANDELTPETGDNQLFDGPKGCGGRIHCGRVQINLWMGQPGARGIKDEFRKLEVAKDSKIISSRDLVIDGEPAFETIAMLPETNFPSGEKYRLITVNHEGKSIDLSFAEFYQDPSDLKKYVSPENWELSPIYDHMVSSLKFVANKK